MFLTWHSSIIVGHLLARLVSCQLVVPLFLLPYILSLKPRDISPFFPPCFTCSPAFPPLIYRLLTRTGSSGCLSSCRHLGARSLLVRRRLHCLLFLVLFFFSFPSPSLEKRGSQLVVFHFFSSSSRFFWSLAGDLPPRCVRTNTSGHGFGINQNGRPRNSAPIEIKKKCGLI